MILFELTNTEQNDAYNNLAADNLARQYSFLESIIDASMALNRPMLSTAIIKALNVHAIACLHVSAGEYRPCEVAVGQHNPPAHYRVPEIMNGFVNEVNRFWDQADPIYMAAYVLWRVNHIHPFINGNGRTARALCYFVLCMKAGGLLKGDSTLPELIKSNREEYVELLREADGKFSAGEDDYLQKLSEFIQRLLEEQIAGVPDPEKNHNDAE